MKAYNLFTVARVDSQNVQEEGKFGCYAELCHHQTAGGSQEGSEQLHGLLGRHHGGEDQL